MNLALFAASLLCAPLLLVAPVESLLVMVAVVCLWLTRGYSRLMLVAAAALLLVGCARAFHAIRASARDQYALQFPSPMECEGAVLVIGRARGHRDSQGTRFSSLVETGALRCTRREGTAVSYSFQPPLRMMLSCDAALHRGDRADVDASVALVYPWDNPGVIDRRVADAARGYVVSANARHVTITSASQSILSISDRARDAVRNHIWETYPTDVEPLVRALVIGETDLRAEDTDALKGAGLLHLLAVSGMHLVVVLGAIQRALLAVLIRVERIAGRVDVFRVASVVSGVLAFAYADFAGGSGSAWRAAWMSGMVACVSALERKPCAKRALAASVLAMVILDPLAVFDLSLVLSVLATLGLLSSVANSKENYLYKSIRTTAAATIPCAPVLAKMGGTLSLGALVANLVAVPLGEMITLPVCLVEPLCGTLPWLQMQLMTLGTGGLRAVMAIARGVSQIGILQLSVPTPSPMQVSVLIVGAILGFRSDASDRGVAVHASQRAIAARVLALTLCVALEWKMRAKARATGELSMIALDVGQGDATLIHFPDGQWGLIDAGGLVGPGVDVGERVIAPVLRSLRVRELAVVVLSHPHPDHFGGMKRGLTGVPVAQVWDTGQGEREAFGGEYAAWLASLRDARIPVLRPESLCGVRSLYGAEVSVLAPCPTSDESRTPNDNSFVIKIGYKSRSFLFVGDAERQEESLLLESDSRLRADVLKVGHHGSRTSSSTAFLAAVSPTVATISSGVRNRFGHPHPDTLKVLSGANVAVFRTDRSGAIRIATDGEELRVEVAR